MFLLPDTNTLYHAGLLTGRWSQDLGNLWQTLISERVPVVITKTVEFELSRRMELRRREIHNGILKAHLTLQSFGFPSDVHQIDEIIKVRSVVEMLRVQGVHVLEERPSPEDYEAAHEITCRRLNPFPENWTGGGDSMRDILIWCVAVRLARERGAGILLSGDKLFNNREAKKPESQVRLVILRTPSQVTSFFWKQNPSTLLIQRLLELAWLQMRAHLPLADDFNVSLCIPRSFRRGPHGQEHEVGAFVRTKFQDARSNVEISANIVLKLSTQVLGSVNFSDLSCKHGDLPKSKILDLKIDIDPKIIEGTLLAPTVTTADGIAELQQRLRGYVLEQLSANLFEGCPIKLIWGDRGIVVHDSGEASVCRFSKLGIVAEVAKGIPCDGVEFLPTRDGLVIMYMGEVVYEVRREPSRLVDPSGRLPEISWSESDLKIGGMSLSGNLFVGGPWTALVVSEHGFEFADVSEQIQRSIQLGLIRR